MIKDIPNANLAYFLLRSLVSKAESNEFGSKGSKLKTFSNILDACINEGLPPKESLDKAFTADDRLFSSSSVSVENTYREFRAFLCANVDTPQRLLVLHAVCTSVMPRINDAVRRIPTKEAMVIARKAAEKTLAAEGDAAIERIINEWDDLTLRNCLTIENDLATELAGGLTELLDKDPWLESKIGQALIPSALQEFERRAGQKRKGRSGDDLHQAVATILTYIGIDHNPVPELISGVLEADLSVKHGKYHTLISCKRTGRERVKQATTDIDELRRLRIRKMVWFFTHFDQSKDRVIDMGARGNIFYLPDSSEDYSRLVADTGTAPYVLPISRIRITLPEIVRGNL